MSRVVAAGIAPILLVGLSGCDPCFGVVQCEAEPRLALEGEFVVHYNGEPVGGVEVEFERTGGIPLEMETLRAVSNSEGRFRMVTGAESEGSVTGDFIVRPQPWPEYRVRGVELATARGRGEGEILPRWVVDPYFPYVGEVYSRATGRPLAGASIEFRRTGGVAVSGALVDGVYRAVTDQVGRFVLLQFVYASGAGEVVGDLRIDPGGGARPIVVSGVRLESTHEAYRPFQLLRWGTGASMRYVGELRYRGSWTPAAGVEVEYRRIGGVAATPETFVATTDQAGRFALPLIPEGEGEVIAELTFRPPQPFRPVVVSNVRIPSFEGDQVRLLGVWNIGFSFNYVGELLWRDTFTPASGVTVEFRRTGGVEVNPSTFTTITDPAGRFPLTPRPLAEGEVVFDLVVTPPAPRAPFTIQEIRMRTTEADAPALLGVWTIPPQ